MAENKGKTVENFETLSPEDLEGVSGGNCKELSSDSYELSKLGLCGNYDYYDLLWAPGHCQAVVDAWKKAGVDCRFSDVCGNTYYINGKKVSRNDAINFVKNR